MGKIVTFGEIMLRLAPNGYNRFFQDDQLFIAEAYDRVNLRPKLMEFLGDRVGDGAAHTAANHGHLAKPLHV